MRAHATRLVVAVAFVPVVAGCGGRGTEGIGATERPLADALTLLPDKPELRRHVLVADLERLRRAYPLPRDFRTALVGVWLPDALVGAGRALWLRTFGLRLDDVSSFASAGFHPAEITVAEGKFSPATIRSALRRSGYRARGPMLVRGADGSLDASTEAGRLALSALNRVSASRARVIAASTSELVRAAGSPPTSLGTGTELAAAAEALDPITAAIVLDADLVRPPSGVPTTILPEFAARLVAVGIDDQGSEGRTLKIALVYDDTGRARSDAALIESGDLAAVALPGAPGSSFSDLASDWRVQAAGRTIVVTAMLPPSSNAGTWRLLVERGDLAPLVKPGI